MRKKTYDVLLRLDEAERDHLKEQVALSGFNTTQYLRGLIANEKMRPRPPNEYAEIRRQLAAIGNNINQIARAVNARGFASQEDIDTVASAQREIWQMMEQL